jgi:hypothetical protein
LWFLHEENGRKFAKLFYGFFTKGPFFPSSQGFNISYYQRLRSFQVVNLSSLFQPLGFGLGLSVNVSLNALKLGVRFQIDKRLWNNGKF